MGITLRADELFRDRLASRDVDDESRYERSQIESAVEPLGEVFQVMACVLAVLQRMKSTGQGVLQVTEHCVDPLEPRQIAGLKSADDRRPVATSSVGRHERHLVLGAASWLAAGAFATGVGVVKLDRAFQALSAVLLSHGAINFLVQQSAREVAVTQVQRQLGVFHQPASGRRGLVSAAVALIQPAGGLAEDAVIGAVATRTTEPIRPSRLLDGLGARCLSAEALKEFWNGHALLELDLVEGHGFHSPVGEAQLTGQLAHRLSLA